eukprot:GCRY01000719.1.p1 GENE.GCRY01000719.1~~GCRY01000719.1.p1  ORF type:complete len:492 (+),score=99.87 GCRY01000719.1:106-1581(+)
MSEREKSDIVPVDGSLEEKLFYLFPEIDTYVQALTRLTDPLERQSFENTFKIARIGPSLAKSYVEKLLLTTPKNVQSKEKNNAPDPPKGLVSVQRNLVIGLDVGSRATKGVLYDADANMILSFGVTDTSITDGNIDNLIQTLCSLVHCYKDEIRYTISTGYGRFKVSGCDESMNEVACHALGVKALYPTLPVTRVLDIGGQDSKALHLEAPTGAMIDFQLNDRCAAGTGRFLEMAARILGTSVSKLSDLTMGGSSDWNDGLEEVPISSTCVVFAESELIGLLATNKHTPQSVARGLHTAVAKRVCRLLMGSYTKQQQVQSTASRDYFVFTGGVALNTAMCLAIKNTLNISSNRMLVPAAPQYTGALGAALLAARKLFPATSPQTPPISVNNLQIFRDKGPVYQDGAIVGFCGRKPLFVHENFQYEKAVHSGAKVSEETACPEGGCVECASSSTCSDTLKDLLERSHGAPPDRPSSPNSPPPAPPVVVAVEW